MDTIQEILELMQNTSKYIDGKVAELREMHNSSPRRHYESGNKRQSKSSESPLERDKIKGEYTH